MLARVWERFGSAQRVPRGQERAGAPAKLKADGGAHWSNEEPKGCPVPQEYSALHHYTHKHPEQTLLGTPPGEDLLSLPPVFSSGEHRIIWAQPTHSSPSVQSPEHSLNSQICPYLWFLRRQQECLSAHPCTGEGNKVSMVWGTILLGWFPQPLSQRPKALLDAVRIKNNLQTGRFWTCPSSHISPSCWGWMQ